jgi:Cys-tRNA(Pro)/Cys-tRNA(Cys) deacylase
VRALIGNESLAPLLPDFDRYAALATAVHRLRVAQAVLDDVVAGTESDPDPMVVRLACEELHAAEAAYCRLRDAVQPSSLRLPVVAGTPATALLIRRKVRYALHDYPHDPRAGSYGLAAAEALGVPAERVYKTLVARVDGALVVGVVPVGGSLDLKSLAAAVGGKRAALAEPADAERATGYVVGGISPIGQRRQLPTVIDASASGHETVFVSGGRRGLEIELAPADLAAVTAAILAPIARA